MFEAIKGIIGDIAAGSIKDQRIALSQEQLIALNAKLEVLTGELANAHLRKAELQNRVSELQSDNANLRLQIQRHQPDAHGLTEEDIAALKFLDTAGDEVYPAQVAVALGIAKTRAVWLLDRLTGLERVWCRPVRPHSYFITQKGRDVVHNP